VLEWSLPLQPPLTLLPARLVMLPLLLLPPPLLLLPPPLLLLLLVSSLPLAKATTFRLLRTVHS
jgi:hypothetical protein